MMLGSGAPTDLHKGTWHVGHNEGQSRWRLEDHHHYNANAANGGDQ